MTMLRIDTDDGRRWFLPGDTLSGRLSLYHNEDKGWFENLFDGSDFGAASTTVFRPVISWEPNENVTLLVRWEHMESDNDGPASQTHTNGSGVPGFWANFERDSFDFAIDEEGEDIRVHVVSSETAFEWLDQGRIDSALPIIALQWFRLNRNRIRSAGGERAPVLHADDPAAVVDIPHFCQEQGHILLRSEETDGVQTYLIERKR